MAGLKISCASLLLATLTSPAFAVPAPEASCLDVSMTGPQWVLKSPFFTALHDHGLMELEFNMENLADGTKTWCFRGGFSASGTCGTEWTGNGPDSWSRWDLITGNFTVDLTTGDLQITQNWTCKDEGGKNVYFTGTGRAVLPKHPYYTDAVRNEDWNCYQQGVHVNICDLRKTDISMTAVVSRQ